jgi:predicted acyltransferase
MTTLLLTYGSNVWQSTFILFRLGGAALLLNACTPVISPQLMDQVDRSLTYSSLASRPDEFTGKVVLLRHHRADHS